MILNENLLQVVKSFLNLEFEVCGSIKDHESSSGNKIILEIHSQYKEKTKEEDNDRSHCYHLNYSKYIFHTHPYYSKSYPSASDIIKVLNNSVIISSLIFTKWGIWEIYSDKKMKFSESQKTETKEILNKFLKDIYEKTDGGRADVVNYDLIEGYIKKMEFFYKKFGLEINLTPWSRIVNYDIVFT